MQPSSTVHIIIPVFRGLDETRRCIHSVLTSNVQTPFRVVVIDDSSPEPALSAWLVEMAAQDRRIELLRNDTNRGFVASVNRGMRNAAGHDVLLLNSDTEVANDWLDRLVRCAYSAQDIGTVTPFSNNATICSYPFPDWNAGLPGNLSLQELDRLFTRVNAGRHVEIPTAVGFCMYIRGDCLQQVGLFDEERFGRGYGEENDFSQRAKKHGWKNVACCDVFIFHAGSVSFGKERAALSRQAEQRLGTLHPGYHAEVQTFIELDPLRVERQRVNEARLEADSASIIVHELHRETEVLQARLRQRAEEAHVFERQLATCSESFTRTDRALAEAQELVRERDQNLRRMESELGERIATLHAQLDACNQKLQETSASLARIQNTRIWRFSRRVLRLFKRT